MATLPDEEIVVQIDDRQQVRVWRRARRTHLGSANAFSESRDTTEDTFKTDSQTSMSEELRK